MLTGSGLRSQISAADLDGARATAKSLRGHAHEAHDLTTGPLWAGSAALPWLGDPLDSARSITASVDRVAATALPALVDASDGLDPGKLRRPDGSVDLATISGVAPALDDAAGALSAALHGIDQAPSSTWLGSVDSARKDLLGQLTGLQSTVDSAKVAGREKTPAPIMEPTTKVLSVRRETWVACAGAVGPEAVGAGVTVPPYARRSAGPSPLAITPARGIPRIVSVMTDEPREPRRDHLREAAETMRAVRDRCAPFLPAGDRFCP